MSIEISQSDLARVESLLRDIKNGSKRALTNAINKTLTNVQTRAAKDVGADLALTAKRIKQDFTIKKANFSDISGSFVSKGEPIGLVQYAGKQTKKGVSFKVKRIGKRTTLKHAFIAKGKGASKSADGSTKTHVFWREYSGPRNYTPKWMSIKYKGFPYSALPEKYRLPLERRTGPRIEDILGASRIFDPLQKFASERFIENLETQITDILRRHNG